MHTKNIFAYLIIISTVIMGCSNNTSFTNAPWKNIDVKIDTLLEIQEDSMPFIPYPEFIVSDSKNNIIIVERTQQKLFVFNSNGDFIKTIGKRGPGPAEFSYIGGMTIDSNDVITVFDRDSQMFKEFYSSGEYIRSRTLNSTINGSIEFGEWRDYRLLYYLVFNPNDGERNFLYVLSDQQIIAEGISFDEVRSEENNYVHMMGDVGNHTIISKDTIIFVPALYDGTIFKYAINKTSGDSVSVQLADKQKGITYLVSIEVFNSKGYDGYSELEMNEVGEPQKNAIIHNQSKALFKIGKDNIAHVTYVENAESTKRTLGIELYDSGLNPIGYGKILDREFDSHEIRLLGWNFAWKDEENRFYIIDRSVDGFPVIRVIKFRMGK